MIKYSGNTINDWFYASDNIIKVYKNNAVCYYKISTSSPTPPTPTYEWVSYSEGDTIPYNNVKYGIRIPTQVFYDVFEFEGEFLIEFDDGATVEPDGCLFYFSYDGTMTFEIEGQSITLDYDPEVDDYLEIIFSDYSSKEWILGGFIYENEYLTEFPFGMELYEEDTPT